MCLKNIFNNFSFFKCKYRCVLKRVHELVLNKINKMLVLVCCAEVSFVQTVFIKWIIILA
jgi:hypothetical protein